MKSGDKKSKDFHGFDTSLVEIKVNLRSECQNMVFK